MKITDKNIKDLEFFNTTMDLNLKDGSKIEKGTEFIVEDFKSNNEFSVHFSENANNYYARENGDGYNFSIEEINLIGEPTKFAMDRYSANEAKDNSEEGKDKQAVTKKVNNTRFRIDPAKGKLDFKYLNDLNKRMYGNLYELPRIPLNKIMSCKSILKDLKKEKPYKVNNIDEFAAKTNKYISNIYNLGLFEKGNTNTLKEFTRSLGIAAGFNLDFSNVSDKDFETGCLKSCEGNFNTLSNIIKGNSLNVKPLKELMKVFEISIEMDR